jgi:hypothetical protein
MNEEFVQDIKSFDDLFNEVDINSIFPKETEIKIQKLLNFLQPSTETYGNRLKISNYIQNIAKKLNMKVFFFIKI